MCDVTPCLHFRKEYLTEPNKFSTAWFSDNYARLWWFYLLSTPKIKKATARQSWAETFGTPCITYSLTTVIKYARYMCCKTVPCSWQVRGVSQQLDHVSGIALLWHFRVTASDCHFLRHPWERCWSRAAVHCDCRFRTPCINTLT